MTDQSKSMEHAVVVTGASTGIGWAAAKILIAHGHHVFGSVRKKDDADRLSREFGDLFTPIFFDITDQDAIGKAAAEVRLALDGHRLAGLVNNAGIAVPGAIMEMPLDEIRRQIDVNIIGAIAVSQAFAPLLGTEAGMRGKPGRIVNIGSIGGRHAFPFNVPYHISKFGLEGLSEGLRRELMIFGIDVIHVAPGSVRTPIWGKGKDFNFDQFKGTPYEKPLGLMKQTSTAIGKRGSEPEVLGEVIYRALTDPKPKVYYRSTNEPLRYHAITKLPKRLVDRLIARAVGIEPPKS